MGCEMSRVRCVVARGAGGWSRGCIAQPLPPSRPSRPPPCLPKGARSITVRWQCCWQQPILAQAAAPRRVSVPTGRQ